MARDTTAKATILRHGVPGVEFPTGGTQACQSIEQAQAMADAANRITAAAWQEYDSAAAWCAKRGLKGVEGDPLPEALSSRAQALIDEDPEAFEQRVRDTAYAIAMEGR